jgi:hypothetical protein
MFAAVAGGKAFFAGGFANDPTAAVTAGRANSGRAWAGYRSSVVDIYDSKTEAWSVAHLSTNRSNLAA